MFTSWKTTTAGLITILGAVFALKKTFLPAWNGGDFTAIAPAIAALFTGIGLVCAKDHDANDQLPNSPSIPPLRGISQKDPNSSISLGGLSQAGAVPTSAGSTSTESGSVDAALIWMIFLVGVVAAIAAAGCAGVRPGQDVLVVRAEQAESGAVATFDLVTRTDDADRDFWRQRAPEFHKFVEFLREPMIVIETNSLVANGTNVVTLKTNALPRAVAMVRSVDVVKRDYQAGRASSNAVVAVLATLEGLARESALHWASVTNLAAGK